MQLVITDQSGARIHLGKELGRGGEGSVFQIGSDSSLVAKIYHQTPAAQRASKLKAMTTSDTRELAKFTAWPQTLLFHSGGVRGFVMRRVEGHDIHELYSPKSRRSEFPSADFRFIIRASANLARAFAAIHARGCVIGDVNHGSVKVSSTATTTLIDCDSFQIDSNGSTYLCSVAEPTFTPPEVQGKDLKIFVRTSNHDLFGLAVLVFQLLMMGRHPFVGRFSGHGDMPVDKAIAEFRYAYGVQRRAFLMEPPPHSAPIESLPPTIQQLFESAFSPAAARNANRPTADQWVQALSSFEGSLRQCKDDAGHHYFSALNQCPWCGIEKSIGIVLFGIYVGNARSTGAFNLAVAWAAIEKVQAPGPPPQLPAPNFAQLPTLPEIDAARSARGVRIVVSLLISALGLLPFIPELNVPGILTLGAAIGAWACWPGTNSEVHQKLQAAERAARTADDAMDERWEREATPKPFFDKKSELLEARNRLTGLAKLRQDKLNELNSNREKHQRERFLEGMLIAREKIPGIGPTRIAQLGSYGITDAADVVEHRILQIPGFGPGLTAKLIVWRRMLEAQFRFDASKGVDPIEIRNIEREIAAQKQKYETQLVVGARELEALKKRIEIARERLWPERIRTHNDYAKALHYLKQL